MVREDWSVSVCETKTKKITCKQCDKDTNRGPDFQKWKPPNELHHPLPVRPGFRLEILMFVPICFEQLVHVDKYSEFHILYSFSFLLQQCLSLSLSLTEGSLFTKSCCLQCRRCLCIWGCEPDVEITSDSALGFALTSSPEAECELQYYPVWSVPL